MFTFTQQDSNTTTGTSYNAGSCPDNTTFGTNGSIARVYNKLNSVLNTKVIYTTVAGDTYGSAMTKLANIVDFSKLTEKSSMKAGESVAQCSNVSTGQFINTQIAESKYDLIRYDLANHNVIVWTTNTTGTNKTDYTNKVLNAGTTFEIWY